MLKMIFRLAFRNLRKQKFYAIINITGLTIGFWSFMIIMLYVSHEMSFDRFNINSKRIYRLSSGTNDRGPLAMVPYKWGEVLKEDWPEIEELASVQNITIGLTVKNGDDLYSQHGVLGVDSSFLKIFDFPVVTADRNQLLKAPDKMVITPEMAMKYFKDGNPIGETLQINLWGTDVLFEIEGVVACPEDSHLQFQMLIPMQSVKQNFFSQEAFHSWRIHFAYTYILLANEISTDQGLEAARIQLNEFLERHGGADIKAKYNPDLQPLEEIYLKPPIRMDFPPRGSEKNVRILTLIAFGILIMAMINFVNISTAQSLRRLKEFGLQKVLGASRRGLIVQYACESVIISLIALVLAWILIIQFLPYFNEFTWKSIAVQHVLNYSNTLMMLAIALLVGSFSSIFPVFTVLSNGAMDLIGSNVSSKNRSGALRKGLVVSQFVLAILLLVATGVVYEQVVYMNRMDLGFNKDQVIVMNDAHIIASDPQHVQLLREKLTKYDQIIAVSASSSYPGEETWSDRFIPEGYEKKESLSISTIYVDHDFLKTYEIPIVAGRDYDRAFASDSGAYLINSAAAKLFASKDTLWDTEPINKKLALNRSGREGPVIGVFEDFHVNSIKNKIEPLVIGIEPENFFAIQIKVNAMNITETLNQMESVWVGLFPQVPFSYRFIDQEFEQLFQADQKLGQVLRIFAMLSIFVAVLGLFGQAAMLAHEKSKEVGIRKVMGATENQLIAWLSWQFLMLILFANLLAIPMSYVLMTMWLEGYAYRIDIPVYVLLVTAVSTVFITLFTVSYHTLKTANTNPTEVLAQE